MVRQYSKKTEIKEDDDLRSYVNQGLLDGIRKFDPKRGSKFIYFAHIWMKKNIFLERRHTGLLGYRLIKSILRLACQERAAAELLNSEHSHSHGQKFMALENTKTDFFTDLVTFDVESGLQELPEHLLHQTNIKTFNDEETLSLDVLKSNIQQVLANFNQKEIYIIEHLLGSMRELLSSEEIAANLKVTKVNITFTKTRIIRC
jgi:RNA polymerase sigma factor (sigma-70 family)